VAQMKTRVAGRRAIRASGLSLVLALATAAPAFAQFSQPMSVPPPGPAATAQIPMLRNVGIDQKLDNAVPLDTPFVDETGRDVRLAEYFGSRPVVLVLAYYECPMLCTQVINATVSSMLPLTFNAGQEFNVVVVSFDPGETPAMARAKRDDFLKRYGRPADSAGIHFLTGRQESIAALTAAVGFRYAYDASIDQYAHPAVITILTPKGHVSRYLFGIEFAPRDLRFALIDAAGDRIGTVIDQAMLFCYQYDPEKGSYGFAIMTAVRLGGLAIVAAIGAFIVVNLRRDRRQARAVSSAAAGTR